MLPLVLAVSAGLVALACNGEDGKDGKAGPEGPQGPQGSLGPEGPEGPAGEQGPTGIMGEMGLQGPKGETGPQGEMGPQGPQGATGPQGPAGPQGTTGPQGPQGPQGLQGPKGNQGAAGPMGPPFDLAACRGFSSTDVGTNVSLAPRILSLFCSVGEFAFNGGCAFQSSSPLIEQVNRYVDFNSMDNPFVGDIVPPIDGGLSAGITAWSCGGTQQDPTQTLTISAWVICCPVP
jgi:hypothetical protein